MTFKLLDRHSSSIVLLGVIIGTSCLFWAISRRFCSNIFTHASNFCQDGTKASSQARLGNYNRLTAVKEASSFRSFTKEPKPKLLIEIRGIVSGKAIEASGMSFHRSRRIPNQRLVELFAVDNPFTSEDVAYCIRFRSKANELVNLNPDSWIRFSRTASDLTRHLVRGAYKSDDGRLGLVQLFQVLVFRAILTVVFPERKVASQTDDDCPSEVITDAINHLWMASKKVHGCTSLDSSELEDQIATNKKRLWENMGAMVLGTGYNGELPSRENPLNLIIPAYENMWRVVMRCYLEVACREEHEKPEWTIPLEKLAETPDKASFTKVYGKVSAEHIVKEALRLYPPTKTIYRAIPSNTTAQPEIIAADIRSLHRCKTIWGPDADRFQPERWAQSSKSELKLYNNCLMAFGGAPYACPAQNAAPRMIGILVGAMITEIGVGFQLKGLEKDEDLGDGKPLCLSRDAFAGAGLEVLRRN